MANKNNGVTNSDAKVPTLGKPFFTVEEAPLNERLAISSGRGYPNSLVYFAVNAVMVKSLEFEGDSTSRIIINKGMTLEGNESKSLEYRLDLEKNFSREASTDTIFVDEATANKLAERLNKSQKDECGKFLDAFQKAYSEYDKIIAICKETAREA